MMDYTKEDLVEFLRWNSNAPVSVLKKASREQLETFMNKKPEVWDKFFNSLSQYRECRQLEQDIRKAKKALGI